MTIPNGKGCSPAGSLRAGAICAHTLEDKTEDMDLDQFLDFLQPREAYTDRNGVKHPEKGGAICFSSEYVEKLFTATLQACSKLGPMCNREIQSQVNDLGERLGELRSKARPGRPKTTSSPNH